MGTPDATEGRSTADFAQRNREKSSAWQRAATQRANDIGAGMPAIVDSARRKACGESLQEFCQTYFPDRFCLSWSQSHIVFIDEIQQRILAGGKKAKAMPRGSGKTSLLLAAAAWAALYGYRKYLFFVAVSSQKAKQAIDTLKTDLAYNPTLLADFPEVCYPLRSLENRAIRCIGQTCNRIPTASSWEAHRIVLPQIPIEPVRRRIAAGENVENIIWSPASTACFQAAGITSGDIRGAMIATPGGETRRPDFAIVDDPQDDDVAASRTQCAKRETLIDGAVLGMSGPTTSISAFLACTVIQNEDLASRYLDKKTKPEWHGDITQMMPSLPNDLDLWDEYKTLRDADIEQGGDGQAGLQFYLENRDKMDAGASVSWEERIESGCESAIETAMLKFLYTPVTFAAEYQNQPLADETASVGILPAGEIAEKVSSLPALQVPSETHTITAHIDVHQNLLYYVVVALQDNFSGVITDYGAWPSQRSNYFTLSGARKTIETTHPGVPREAALRQSLMELIGHVEDRTYLTENKQELNFDLGLIDANWGESTPIIRTLLREQKYRGRWLPAHGVGITVTKRALNDNKPKPGERRGTGWQMRSVQGMPLKQVIFDSNSWKTFAHARLATPRGAPGSIELFAGTPARHRLFAEHMHAEYPQDVSSLGRTKRQWRIRPGDPDNHLLDSFVGACVAGAMQGISLDVIDQGRRAVARQSQRPKSIREVRSSGVRKRRSKR